MTIADELVAAFARIIRMDGGDIRILDAEGAAIRLAYTPGTDEECTTGACVLPHLELQEMMREWLARRDPAASVSIRLEKKTAS